MKLISSVSAIAENYDALLLDLWGVVHDGEQLYPDVYETIVSLRKAGKKLIFLSNAPRRASRAAAVLEHLGIESALYDDIVTSGEVGYEWLVSGKSPFGKNYFFIGAEKDHDLLKDTDFNEVFKLEEADFVLNLGFGSEEKTLADFSFVLSSAQELNLPMLCLNPDIEVVKISGDRFPCAGLLARHYLEIGGKVTFFGKPYIEVYGHCHKLLEGLDKCKILAVGDSLETDIAGAKNFGVDCALVMGGILRDKTVAQIEEMSIASALRPNYIMPKFGI